MKLFNRNRTKHKNVTSNPSTPEASRCKPDAKKRYVSLPQSEPNPGDELELTICPGTSMVFCWCPSTKSEAWGNISGGKKTFQMGAATDQEEPENTRHAVTISEGFWIGKFPVTQIQWIALMGTNPSCFQKGGMHPVEGVNWFDSQQYVEKLRETLKYQGVRLPTEAEWEYACRAGSYELLSCPDWQEATDCGWFQNGACGPESTAQVGQKLPNAWGIHDMHGNVEEWCWDVYADYGSDLAIDPIGPKSGTQRVQRGGAWWYDASQCLPSTRNFSDPNEKGNSQDMSESGYCGFRVLLGSPNHDMIWKGEAKQTTEPQKKPNVPNINVGAERKAGEEKNFPISHGVDMIFCWCPPTTSETWKRISGGKDTFTMGSPKSEAGRDNTGNYELQHEVRLTEGFWIGKYPVTVRQWRSVYQENMDPNTESFKHPKIISNYAEIEDFLITANLRYPEGDHRLPSEAEWEYACRAGTTGSFAGNFKDMAVYYDNSYQEYGHGTFAVGSKKPNPWGIHNMHGNIWEVCEDEKQEYPNKLIENPCIFKSDTHPHHVLRGGCYKSALHDCRSASREMFIEDFDSNVGFRIVIGKTPWFVALDPDALINS